VATTEQVPVLPFDRSSVLEVPPLFLTLQVGRPAGRVISPAGDPAWLITGYRLVKDLLTDRRLGRAHPDPDRAPLFSGSMFGGRPGGTFEREEIEHDWTRQLLSPAFSPKRMQAMQGHVQSLVDDLLDRMAARTPPVDLHEALALTLPILVICELLGVPAEDREQFRRWTEGASDNYDREGARAALAELESYMGGLLRAKREKPGEDVLSDFAAAHAAMPVIPESGLLQLAGGLLWAGHETTVNRIDYGTLLFLLHPDQRDLLLGDPTLLPNAVEEVLRMAAPGPHIVPRWANGDIEVPGAPIRTGDLVLLAVDAANQDEAHFADPLRFDITRHPNQHLSFGHGGRFCLGAGLARLEMSCVFGSLFRRFPTLDLAVPVEQLRFRSNIITGGLDGLPVTW
jgi:cytochrome P450